MITCATYSLARESMAKALELSPRLYVAHVIMGNNYIFGEPRDFTKALGHMQEAEALAPDESNAHMFVGDAYRAQKNLERSEEHTSELQSRLHLVCRLLLEKKK